MKCPNFNEEKKLWKKGYKYVAGLDEVGRGSLAGPVVAAAFMVWNFSIINYQFSGVNDSKKLSAKKREGVYKALIRNPNIKWGIGRVSEKIIDKINIFEASKLAMEKALADLANKLRKKFELRNKDSNKLFPIDYLILDGNFKIHSDILQKPVIRGDQRVFSCAAASIIAKVSRDRMMMKYHKKYPNYGFHGHKGYPTKEHIEILREIGPCEIHRKSFRY